MSMPTASPVCLCVLLRRYFVGPYSREGVDICYVFVKVS